MKKKLVVLLIPLIFLLQGCWFILPVVGAAAGYSGVYLAGKSEQKAEKKKDCQDKRFHVRSLKLPKGTQDRMLREAGCS